MGTAVSVRMVEATDLLLPALARAAAFSLSLRAILSERTGELDTNCTNCTGS